MRLTRIRIEQFRQFRTALEIGDLAPGLNLFTGPNEAGKSTVVAAIRAAFFERHRSASVDDLRPWNEPNAAPTVALDFELNGQPCHLTKTFLTRKRCTLQLGRETLDGELAEDRLAELLGFQYAGRGASKAEHWGIPGLLWIEQGSSQALREAVGHATDHLRGALHQSLGEVTARGGDELLGVVAAQRHELLTEAGARPRGAYKEALDKESALAAELAQLDQEIARYRERVDALAALRREHAADEAEQPWRVLRAQQGEAEARLQAAAELQAALTAERQRAAELASRIDLLRAQLDGFAREEQALAARRAALESARQAHAAATAPLDNWRARLVQAERALEAARAMRRAVRQRVESARLARDAEAAQRQLDTVTAQLQQAEAAQLRVQALQREIAANAIDPQDLKTLRAQARELADIDIRCRAVATRLTYELEPGQQIALDGQALTGHGEIRLLALTTLVLPGLGRLEIAPGGGDLAALTARAAELADAQRMLLARLGLDSLAAAEARELTQNNLQNDLAIAQASLRALAPQGLDALRAEHTVWAARAKELAQALERLPPAADTPAELPTAAEAEAAELAAAQTVDALREDAHRAELAAADAHSRLEAAIREHAAAHALCEAPERAQRLAAASGELTAARAEQAALAARIGELERQLAAARPEILQQDVERLRASAEQLERQHHERRERLLRLEVALQTEGARGLDERRAELARDHAQAARRATELRRRAAALDLLLGLLRDQRRALTRRLQAPLQKHLNRYLQLPFPQASIEIDEDLAPGPLIRPKGGGSEWSEFEALSFGAREQMGVIARLAYADLLAEAGRPTLLILDDALVHSDAERLAQMKRVLFDAATRHQILLFTCHPANWRDLGVPARTLSALRG